jgi:hypothetical protein
VRRDAGGVEAARLRQHRLERQLRVGDDAEIGLEDAPDLRRFDVDVDEAAVAAIGREIARVPARKACADSAYHVAFEKKRVCEGLTRLDADDAGVERVVFVDRAFAHQRR